MLCVHHLLHDVCPCCGVLLLIQVSTLADASTALCVRCTLNWVGQVATCMQRCAQPEGRDTTSGQEAELTNSKC